MALEGNGDVTRPDQGEVQIKHILAKVELLAFFIAFKFPKWISSIDDSLSGSLVYETSRSLALESGTENFQISVSEDAPIFVQR